MLYFTEFNVIQERCKHFFLFLPLLFLEAEAHYRFIFRYNGCVSSLFI